jgi:hypothetical protein
MCTAFWTGKTGRFRHSTRLGQPGFYCFRRFGPAVQGYFHDDMGFVGKLYAEALLLKS